MLEKLAENHTMWIKMVVNMGCDVPTAQDIVQSMYLRMHRLIQDKKKIMYNDEEVNRFFVFVTLKNMFIDYKKAKGKYEFFEYIDGDGVEEVPDEFLSEDTDFEENEAFTYLTEAIAKEMGTWLRYDIILSSIYFKTDYSLRDISGGSGISLTSIFNSIKNYRSKLQAKFGEDYQDYINGDYHLLK